MHTILFERNSAAFMLSNKKIFGGQEESEGRWWWWCRPGLQQWLIGTCALVTWPTWTGAMCHCSYVMTCQGSTLLTTIGWHWLTLIPSSALSGSTSTKIISSTNLKIFQPKIFQQELEENILEHFGKYFIVLGKIFHSIEKKYFYRLENKEDQEFLLVLMRNGQKVRKED